MKYHVKLTSMNPKEIPFEDEFDYAEINVVKEMVILIQKVDAHKVLHYAVPLNELKEITIVPYEDNESKISSC